MSFLRGRAALAALAASLAAGASAPAQAQGTRPVAQWGFDEGTGATAADTSGSYAGTLNGDASRDSGLVGAHALRLSGRPGSYVEIPQPVIDTTHSFTAAACVKLSRVSGYQTFVSIDGSQISGFFLQLRDDTGEFALTMPPGDGTSGDTAIASSHIAPDPNVWYHVAGVYDASAQTLALYVNGVLQETVPFKSPWRAAGSTAIGRGKYGGNPVDFVRGDLDDVRLYDTALPAAQIRALARADLPPGTDTTAAAAPSGPANLTIDAAHPGPRVSPMLYGLMTEEINYSYDGGLYGELIRNRQFKDDPTTPAHWSLVQDGGGSGEMTLDTTQPLNAAQSVSLKFTVQSAANGQRVGIANDGYWGVPIKPGATYRASFWAKAAPGFSGPLMVSLEGADGKAVCAPVAVSGIGGSWRKYTATLRTGASVAPTAKGRFVIAASRPGTVWFSLVSLFPPTYRNRPNGNRIDLMEKLAAMRPAFLRLPGGNYLEGDTIATRFDWKKTIGPLEDRPGHPGPWGYRSTDGMGLLEFLEWCEDMGAEPVLAVYAGYSLRGEHVNPGTDLQPYVQDALDEIEYVTGSASTKWGAQRVRDGHPKPFPLHYVEIGNEDWFDRSGSYDGRFAQFHDAIKAKYPALQTIATATVKSRRPDVIDEHYYKPPRAFERDAHHYDSYDRKGPKIFVGEWASQSGRPTPDMNAALGDAAWMTGMERNSDIVVLESYAPLFVNVNPGGSQWGTNLIGYNGLSSYGSPSYWAQAMFATHHGDTILPSTLADRQVFASVTKDSKSGTLFVKLVNTGGIARPVHVTVQGVSAVAPTGTAITLSGSSPAATNTLAAPRNIVPVTRPATGLGKAFSYPLPPYSVTVLRLQAR